MTVGRTRLLLWTGAAVAVAGLVATAMASPRVAAAGWLLGFLFWAQVLLGSLSLVMIHRLTSGHWGYLIAPVTDAMSRAVPLLLLLAVPLFVSIPVLYPWTQHPESIKPDVLSFYLNRPAFIVRSVIALVGWSALALLLPRMEGWRGELLAGLGLVFHALAISSVSVDWYLSLEAPFTSSSFGASVAVSALIAALAWAAVCLRKSDDESGVGDVGGLLLASVLGLTYIDFMAVLVIWYGDLPHEEAWFVARDRFPWNALAVAAFVLASLGPILALIQSKFRNERGRLRIVGVATLAGLAVYDAYLVLPPFGAAALATSLLGIAGIGCALLAVVSFMPTGPIPTSREPAHAR